MTKLALVLFISLLTISCKNEMSNDILVTSNLQSQTFTIDPVIDTVIHTSHATTLRIRKGTFDSRTPVLVEIKEAFTPQEILSAGLTTMSDGRPLRSSGMIYFNATADGKQINPSQAIDVSIPTKDPDPEMLVFKGEETDEGINWIEPQSLDTSKPEGFQRSYEAGRALFLSKCASCHNIFREGAYPALNNFQYRGPWKNEQNILKWVNNPAKFMATNSYTDSLYRKFKSMMVSFPLLRMADIRNLATYINNVKIDEPNPFLRKDTSIIGVDTSRFQDHDQISADCGYDTSYITYKEDFPEYDTSIPPAFFRDTSAIKVSPYDDISRDFMKEAYDFEIKQNGWYNVDAFLKVTENGVEEVILTAELKLEQEMYMNVFLLIPTERVSQQTDSKIGTRYYFDMDNGKVTLPIGHRAVILVFGSKGDKIYYGVSEFTIGKSQNIIVDIKETTKEKLQNILYSKNIDGISLEAKEKRVEINKIDCEGKLTDVTPYIDSTASK